MTRRNHLALILCASGLGISPPRIEAAPPLLESQAQSPPLPEAADRLYRLAQSGRQAREAQRLEPEIRPTQDGNSFFVLWRACPNPLSWVVSLHGSNGFATEDLAVWHRHLKGRALGLICVQWWLGRQDAYLPPQVVYRELDLLLASLGVSSQSCLLHGFSRGSTQTFALAALDHYSQRHYFRMMVAHSGGVGEQYPPTASIDQGLYGPQPLQASRWVTVAGARDPNPERDGLPGMRRTAQWLQQRGAQVLLQIEDPLLGHGALHLSLENGRKVLDLFENSEVRKQPSRMKSD